MYGKKVQGLTIGSLCVARRAVEGGELTLTVSSYCLIIDVQESVNGGRAINQDKFPYAIRAVALSLYNDHGLKDKSWWGVSRVIMTSYGGER